jgi:signal peptidase I
MKTRNRLVGGFIVAAVVLTYFLNPFNTPSWSPLARVAGIEVLRSTTVSMEPALPRGIIFLASGWSYLLGEPRVGDVVVFRFPVEPSILYVKRIVAAGGSEVSISKCRAIVDDKPIDGPFAVTGNTGLDSLCTAGPVLVPKDQFFVLGDNRANSLDSRTWGFVPRANVIARVLD